VVCLIPVGEYPSIHSYLWSFISKESVPLTSHIFPFLSDFGCCWLIWLVVLRTFCSFLFSF
jgi:hypothetical protein